MAESEYDDLGVEISLSYNEAEGLAALVEACGNQDDLPVIDAIKYAMKQARENRKRQDAQGSR